MFRPTQGSKSFGFTQRVVLILALSVAGSIAAATPEPQADPDVECRFQLPVMEQNQKYVSQLASLTLFKDCHTQGSYRYYQRWYTNEMGSRRLGARFFALSVIALGALLPLLAYLPKTRARYRMWVAIFGASIVIAQGVSQTFAYDTAWRNFMLTRMKLESAHDTWQHAMIKASLAAPADSLALMEAATDAFAKQISDAVLEETTGFFTAIEEASRTRNAGKPEVDR